MCERCGVACSHAIVDQDGELIYERWCPRCGWTDRRVLEGESRDGWTPGWTATKHPRNTPNGSE